MSLFAGNLTDVGAVVIANVPVHFISPSFETHYFLSCNQRYSYYEDIDSGS